MLFDRPLAASDATSISTMMPPAALKRGGVYGVCLTTFSRQHAVQTTHMASARFRARPCRGSNAVRVFRPSPASTIVVCSFLGMVLTLWPCDTDCDSVDDQFMSTFIQPAEGDLDEIKDLEIAAKSTVSQE